jgi:hypothetical protein
VRDKNDKNYKYDSGRCIKITRRRDVEKNNYHYLEQVMTKKTVDEIDREWRHMRGQGERLENASQGNSRFNVTRMISSH